VLEELKRGRRVQLLGLDELEDDALVLSIGGIGAPAVSIEKLEEGTEGVRVLRALEEFLGAKIDALISAEIAAATGSSPWSPRRRSICPSSMPTAWVAPFPRCR